LEKPIKTLAKAASVTRSSHATVLELLIYDTFKRHGRIKASFRLPKAQEMEIAEQRLEEIMDRLVREDSNLIMKVVSLTTTKEWKKLVWGLRKRFVVVCEPPFEEDENLRDVVFFSAILYKNTRKWL